ncbi:MAG: hypothetical protein H7X80_10400 [bacterium]|nr:hypothetical protein [Candidatus Kapabacteria bacterium]
MDGKLNTDAVHTTIIECYPMYKEDPAFESWLLSKAGSNEERVEEYLDTLSDYGYIDGEGMINGDYTMVPDPAGVVDDMKNRLDRLDAESRDVLRAASVEGPAFSAEFVAKILDQPVESVASAISRAASAGVVRGDGSEDLYLGATDSFRFYPLQLRDMLYDEVPGDQRAEFHMRAIEFLTEEIKRNTEPGAREMMQQMIAEHNQYSSRPAGTSD